MIEEVKRLCGSYGNVQHIFCDDSNVAFIRSLKAQYNERLEYQAYIADLKSRKRNWYKYMSIIPVNFRSEHKEMLANLKELLDSEQLAVLPSHEKVVTSLRTAYAEDGNLKKSVGEYDDILDALLCSCKKWGWK